MPPLAHRLYDFSGFCRELLINHIQTVYRFTLNVIRLMEPSFRACWYRDEGTGFA
jgi:hypothetical protein